MNHDIHLIIKLLTHCCLVTQQFSYRYKKMDLKKIVKGKMWIKIHAQVFSLDKNI